MNGVLGRFSSDWMSENPILALGGIGIELDTARMKYGDGKTVWSVLAYLDANGQLAALNQQVTAQQATIAALQTTVSALQAATPPVP
jgi:hypothetical protein